MDGKLISKLGQDPLLNLLAYTRLAAALCHSLAGSGWWRATLPPGVEGHHQARLGPIAETASLLKPGWLLLIAMSLAG